MKKSFIRSLSVMLVLAMILSVSATAGNALKAEDIQLPSPAFDEKLNVGLNDSLSSGSFSINSDSLSKEFDFSPVQSTPILKDSKSPALNYEEIENHVEASIPSRPDKEIASVGSFPNYSGYLFGSNSVWVELSGNTITLSGNGVVPSSAFNDSDNYYPSNTYNLIIKGNITLSEASFYNLYNLRSVSFQGTLSSLPDYAFYNCRSLRSIELPAAITHIGSSIFGECNSLTDITIHAPNANIDDYAFVNLDSLQRVNMPNGVHRIGIGAFAGCDSITSITVPAGLTELGAYAFSECASLKTVILPESLLTVGDCAFSLCSSLESITMPSAKTFGEGVLQVCPKLKSFTMPDNLESTGGYTFNGCENLENLVFPDNLKIISDRDCFECFSLKQVTLPSSLTTIGNAAFYNCCNLETIEFPDNYILVYAYAFSYCNRVNPIESTVKLYSIGNEAFINTTILKRVEFSPEAYYVGISSLQNNKNLEYVDFNGAAIQFNDHALFGCDNLNTIINPPKFAYVGSAAFHQCPGITEVTLSPNCTSVNEGAFYSCKNLTSVDFNGAKAAIGHHAFALCDNLESISNENGITSLGYYSFGLCEALPSADGFTGVSTLEEGAFYGCTALETVFVGNSLEALGARSFQGCVNLNEFAFPDELESIGDYSFACSGLSGDIVLPENVNAIGIGAFGLCNDITKVILSSKTSKVDDYAFLNCEKLTTVNGADNVSEIGYAAFANCTSLTSASFNSALKKIDDYAFENCEKLSGFGGSFAVNHVGKAAFRFCKRVKALDMSELTYIGQSAFCQSGIENVIISSDMDFLGEDAFEACESLKSVRITGSLNKIGDEAFALCTSLNTVQLPEKLEIIGNLAFYGCGSLYDIDLPKSLEEIGNAGFYQCSSLESIVIPDTVEKIGYSCFKECTKLESVTVSDSLSMIDTAVFYGCSSLRDIEIPQSVKEIGFAAFAECDNLENLTLTDGLLSIGEYAFLKCKRLKAFAFPVTLKALADCAFANCETLTEAALPAKVSVIGNYVFYQCSNLETVYLSGSIIGFGISAFYQCKKLKDVYLYNGIPAYISEYAFTETAQGLTLHYNSHIDGWSQPQWKGPDGNYYHTESVAPNKTGTLDNGLKWSYQSESGTLIISGNGSMEDYDSSFSLPWYSFVQEITNVIIEDGVISIGSRAFADCPMLHSVSMANSVNAIGDYAFSNCSSLVYCRLSSQTKSIGNYAFYQCSNLDMNLPVNIETIGNYAFYGCRSISDLTLPDSLKDIGEGAFYQCSGLTSVVLPRSLKALKDYTFRGCTSLHSVVIPATVDSIGRYALGNCSNLTNVVLFDAPSFGDYAFAYSTKLKNLRFFDAKPVTIGYGAFKDLPDNAAAYHIQNWDVDDLTAKDDRSIPCASDSSYATGNYNSIHWSFFEDIGLLLINGTGAMSWNSDVNAPWSAYQNKIRTVIVEQGVSSIGSNAFKGCDKLEKVVLADSLNRIEENAFSGCSSLNEVTLPENISALGNKSFYGCSSLSQIQLSDKIAVIPDYAFTNCESLEDIRFGIRLTKIGYSAFYGCELLDSVTFTGDTITVADWAFARCGNMTAVNGSEKISEFGNAAFFGCESLESFTLNDSITSIPDYAFAGVGLSEFVLPSGVKTIGKRSFWGSAVENINFNSVTTIGEAAFFESKLRNVSIPANLTAIGRFAFAGCDSLYSFSVNSSNHYFSAKGGVLYNHDGDTIIQYPIAKNDNVIIVDSNVHSIGEAAFYHAKATNFELPDSINDIGAYAFAKNQNLNSIILPTAITQLKEAVFADCKALERVYVRQNVTSIKTNAFRNCESLLFAFFEGKAPQSIGENAFTDTANDLTFVYGNNGSGWTQNVWHAPDGLDYKSKSVNSDRFVSSITFELNGGTIQSGMISTYLYGVGAELPTDVIKDNCEFVGWYESSDFSGEPIMQISQNSSGDKVFYAKWTDSEADTSVLNFFSQTNEAGKLEILFKVNTDILSESDLTLLSAAYNGKKMIASCSENLSSSEDNCYFSLTANGNVTTDTVFKIMLLSKETHSPMTENLTVKSNYALSGSSCSLSIAPYSADDVDENTNNPRPIDDDNSNPDINPFEISGVASTSGELKAAITLSNEDLQKLLKNADRGKAGGIDLGLTVSYAGDSVEENLTSKINLLAFDSTFGYQPVSDASASGVELIEADSWLLLCYNNTRIASKCKAICERETGTHTSVCENTNDEFYKSVSFNHDGEQILRLRGSGYINAEKNNALVHTGKNRYTLILPYYGLSNIIDLNAKALLDSIISSKAASGWKDVDPKTATISFVVGETTYAKLRFEYDEDGNATNAELAEFHRIGNAVQDGAYNPIAIDETYEPDEGIPLTVESVSPSKGANGKVTVKIIGSIMEASAKPSLVMGTTVIEAEKTYWFTHDRMYATFDLTNAADGVYSLRLAQKDKTTALESCFTVDSSLDMGELSAEINIDKEAAVGEFFSGSITFTNIGYTDVYSPVVFIDTANMELKENENANTFTYQSVFVRNSEGLAGIVANGETASYNFLYKKTSKDFMFKMCNYTELNGEIEDAVVLNEESTPNDYLKANLQALTGIQIPEFAESIAKMACQLDSLGVEVFDLTYLRNAFLVNAEGLLAGSTLESTVDITSRELSLSRYYSTSIVNHQKEGLFGKGWFSEYDITAEYKNDDDNEWISVQRPSGVSVYTKVDGVFTESVYNNSTATFSNGLITLYAKDGSKTFFNSDGNVYRLEDIYGNAVDLNYDENKRITDIRNNLGDSLVFSYENDRLVKVYSPVKDKAVEYKYHDNYLSGVSGYFNAISYQYNTACSGASKNALTDIIYDTGVHQTFSYDTYGRVSEISDGEVTISYSYTDINSILVRDELNNSSELNFNESGNLKRTIDADGNVTTVEYSDYLLTSGISNGLFKRVKLEYDNQHNVSKIHDPANGTVSYTYDEMGNVSSITDRGGKSTSYERNGKGETTRIVYPDGGVEAFEYDNKGNLIKQTKRDGKTVIMSYDELSQIIKEEYSTGDIKTYSYDNRGNCIEINENGNQTYMMYNVRDELTRITYPGGTFISYSYDAYGNLLEEKSYDGTVSMSYKYEYDKYQRLIKVVTGTVVVAEYVYNPDGSLQKQTNYNGTYTEYMYDKNGMLSAIYNYAKDGSVNSFFEYTFDENGNITAMKEKSGTWTYGYDSLGQLTRAVSPNGETTLYGYDYSGNRTSVTINGTTVNYNSNAMNQYTSVGSATLNYDANGNLISSTDAVGTTSYEYDYADRLVKVTEPSGRVTRYGYDVFGLRMGKGVLEPGEQKEITTNYLNSPLGEGYTLVENTGKQFSYYFHGIGLAGRVEHSLDGSSYTLYNYSFNHLGSTAEITDEDGGIVNSYSYNQEGKVTSAVENFDNHLTYVGKYGIIDDKNGLYYDRARYISSATMSFTSPDPIGQNSDLNLYRYVGNNPACNIDISGNETLKGGVRLDIHEMEQMKGSGDILKDINAQIDRDWKNFIDKIKGNWGGFTRSVAETWGRITNTTNIVNAAKKAYNFYKSERVLVKGVLPRMGVGVASCFVFFNTLYLSWGASTLVAAIGATLTVGAIVVVAGLAIAGICYLVKKAIDAMATSSGQPSGFACDVAAFSDATEEIIDVGYEPTALTYAPALPAISSFVNTTETAITVGTYTFTGSISSGNFTISGGPSRAPLTNATNVYLAAHPTEVPSLAITQIGPGKYEVIYVPNPNQAAIDSLFAELVSMGRIHIGCW